MKHRIRLFGIVALIAAIGLSVSGCLNSANRAALGDAITAANALLDNTEKSILAHDIEKTGIKPVDALHIACAITAKCDYLITVDGRMTKYRNNRIVVCSPVDFINREAKHDE